MLRASFDMRSAIGTSNLVDLLRKRASLVPNKVVYTFMPEHENGVDESITYAQLDARARLIAGFLSSKDAVSRPVLLLYPSGIEYIAAFFGCLYAGAIAVPAYPPDPARLERTLPRLQAIADDCGATLVLSSSAICAMSSALAAFAPRLAALSWSATDAIVEASGTPWPERSPRAGDLAFLQYTSGSTSTPKGVMVSHGNLMANEYMISRAMATDEDSVIVGWLPSYPDMGLIGTVLQTSMWAPRRISCRHPRSSSRPFGGSDACPR